MYAVFIGPGYQRLVNNAGDWVVAESLQVIHVAKMLCVRLNITTREEIEGG
eukprot:gene2444-11822_t